MKFVYRSGRPLRIVCTLVMCLFRAQRGGGGHQVRRLGVRSGVAALARRHERDEHGGPKRVLERTLSCHGQLAGHALQRQRRRHWVRWVRCFVDVDCTHYTNNAQRKQA